MIPLATTNVPVPLGDVIVTITDVACGGIWLNESFEDSTNWKRVRPSTSRLYELPSGIVMSPPVSLPKLDVTLMVEPPTSGLNRSSWTSRVNVCSPRLGIENEVGLATGATKGPEKVTG